MVRKEPSVKSICSACYYITKSNVPSLSWSEAVDEALCFGWIDSTKKTIYDYSFIQFFSKRKPKSNWSKINKEKVQQLIDSKRMTKAVYESVTGLPLSPEIVNMKNRGLLKRFPMFSEITRNGVKWEDGEADVILWNTGFRGALQHLEPILPREESGGILMAGRFATMVAKEPRIHLPG